MSLKSDIVEFVRYCGGHFENGDGRNFSMSGINSGHHYLPTYQNTAKIQHCSISKVAFDLFFKPVVSGRFGRLETS
jgi:hypothetical protein